METLQKGAPDNVSYGFPDGFPSGVADGTGNTDGTRAKKRVLAVSPDPRVLAEIKKGLLPCFTVYIAAAEPAAKSAFEAYGADAAVLYAGDGDASFSAYSSLAPYLAGEGIPVLFLAEKDTESGESAAFALGAADYAVKRPSGCESLIRRIRLRLPPDGPEVQASGQTAQSPGQETQAPGRKNRFPSREVQAPGGAAASAGPAPPEETLQDKAILIAEDVAINREFITAMFSGVKNLRLDFVGNGREAVEKFKENSGLYSLILMDVYMPEMDGLDAAKAIRSSGCPGAGKIPIIALSADTDGRAVAGFAEAGMNGYLEKPVDEEKLLRLCAACCAQYV